MAVAALSTAGFSQYLAATTNVSASQQAWQSLQQSLIAGNLSAAKTAFNTYSQLNQYLGTSGASSTTTSSSSGASATLATDMKALGSAIGSGNLSTAQSAFTTVQNDLTSTPSQAMANAETAVNQTVQWVDDLLSLASPSTATTTNVDPTTAILDSFYGLNSSSNTTNPLTSILNNAYGFDTSGSSANTDPSAGASPSAAAAASSDAPAASAPSQVAQSPLAAGNAGSAASVNAYA